MNYSTVYVGMDVHKDSYTLCAYTIDTDKGSYIRKTSANYREILKYLEFLRTVYGYDTKFICGYEAGCLGYSLYHNLTKCNVNCVILAPTTMLEQKSRRRIKTDKRDAELIARCLAQHNYSSVHIPTTTDNKIKEYLRMRSDHKLALKRVKQQINSFCLRHDCHYERKYWTQLHRKWLKSLDLKDTFRETLDEYLLTLTYLEDKITRIDNRISEFASMDEYKESVKKLCCFIGIKELTALSIIVEVGDFNRFSSAEKFASYLGLVPGEHSSGENQVYLSITKAGNSYVRTLLTEASQNFNRGRLGEKSRVLRIRQKGNTPQVIAYADRGNERLRSRYFHFVLGKNKKPNIAKTAVARELACFIWGMMSNHMDRVIR